MSHIMRKLAFCICKNKDADQLHGNREAGQHLCFCYTHSIIPLLLKSKISSLQTSFVVLQPGFCWTLMETPKTGFLTTRLKYQLRRQKTGLRGIQPGMTKTGLYSHRRWLEACNFVFRKERDCTIRIRGNRKVICDFVFAYAKILFSHVAAHIRTHYFRHFRPATFGYKQKQKH